MSNPLYDTVASLLLDTLEATWASEETMATAWALAPFGNAIAFDRTKHADGLIRYLFNSAWREAYVQAHAGARANQAPRPVPMDLLQVAIRLLALSDDYNLLTQVLPNLVPHSIVLDKQGCATELAAILAQNPGLLEGVKGKKAKLDSAWAPEKQAAFARASALSKTASTFDKFTPPSWRISPFGHTPALNDASGLSNLPALADPYVAVLPWADPMGEPVATAYVTWDGGAMSVALKPTDQPNEFIAHDLDQHNHFTSESGGTMLGQVLLSRALAYDAWAFWSNHAAGQLQHGLPIPSFYAMVKLNSLRLVGSASFMRELQQDMTEENYAGMVPGFAWSWDKRAPMKVPAAPVVAPVKDGIVWADDL
jgi:hypothetical protein